MHQVQKIFIYPIKSLGGIALNSSIAEVEGFQNDRRWMLVDVNGQFQTQRESASLALFQTRLDEKGIVVSHNDTDIHIPFNLYNNTIRDVNVFEHKLQAQEISNEINLWFSEKLNKDVQLVKMTNLSHRVKNFVKAPFKTKVSLADGYPYLILGSSSLEFLNSKLEEPILIDRFRPNIVVQTSEPHCEDGWERVVIGDAQFKIVKPCARCVVTTINQQTAEKGKEPLMTLANYRKVGNKVNFGANMVLEKSGIVTIGDSIKFQ